MSIWDDDEVKANVGAYFKLEDAGDEIAGTITAINKRRFVDDKTQEVSHHAELTFMCDDGEERIFTAGQIQTKIQLDEIRPDVGDWLSVKLTSVEKRGNRTLKHIKVSHRPGTGKPAATSRPASAETSRATAGASKPPF